MKPVIYLEFGGIKLIVKVSKITDRITDEEIIEKEVTKHNVRIDSTIKTGEKIWFILDAINYYITSDVESFEEVELRKRQYLKIVTKDKIYLLLLYK